MKILITPIGIYVGRVIKGIATIKPDLIYLCTQTTVSKVEDPKRKELYDKWTVTTTKHAKSIMKKLEILYGNKVKILGLDIRSDDYLPIYKDLLKLILSFDPDTEVYIDTTSTTFPFRVAAITLSIFLKNVRFIYTPASKPLKPEEYRREVILDKGLEPKIIPVPKVDFTELQTGILKDILVTINTRFNHKAPSVTDLLHEMRMTSDKGNMIKMSKMLNKLEKFGCITTKKVGRLKTIELTMIGSSISEVLKTV